MKKTVFIIVTAILCAAIAVESAYIVRLRRSGDEPVSAPLTETTAAETVTEEETTAEPVTEETTQPADTAQWKKAYRDLLQKRLDEEGETGYTYFNLIYIDGDDIPELVIQAGDSHVSQPELYMYYNGEAVYLGVFGGYGSFSYYERENVFISGFGNQGAFNTSYLRLEDGKAMEIVSFYDNAGAVDEEDAEYEVDGKPVSAEEYAKREKEVRCENYKLKDTNDGKSMLNRNGIDFIFG